jgi:hypothetical protein
MTGAVVTIRDNTLIKTTIITNILALPAPAAPDREGQKEYSISSEGYTTQSAQCVDGRIT